MVAKSQEVKTSPTNSITTNTASIRTRVSTHMDEFRKRFHNKFATKEIFWEQFFIELDKEVRKQTSPLGAWKYPYTIYPLNNDFTPNPFKENVIYRKTGSNYKSPTEEDSIIETYDGRAAESVGTVRYRDMTNDVCARSGRD